jgi:Xaa-Pro dipeptidase
MSSARRAELLAAEAKAEALIAAIEAAGLVAPGKSESDLDAEIFALANSEFGVERHWHKRIVRAGPNTLCTFWDNPPERLIAPDDIVYLDLGPVFGEWEADIGRSYALGEDADRKQLVADLPSVFAAVKARFDEGPDITGAELFAFALEAAAQAGWEFGGAIAGHVIGEFPHSHTVPGERAFNLIAPQNTQKMRGPDGLGRERHWIGEIHLVDKARTFGGFYERLL